MQQRTEALLYFRRAGTDVANQLQRFAFGPELFETFRIIVDSHEEPSNRNVKDLRYLPEPAGRNSISATLVFLQLLKCKPKLFSQGGLTQTTQNAAYTHPPPDMNVDRIWALFPGDSLFLLLNHCYLSLCVFMLHGR